MDKELKCPRDNHQLEEGSFHNVQLYRCKKCNGVLLSQKKLMNLLDAMSQELIHTMSSYQEIEFIPDKGAGIKCPVCNKEMDNYGYMESNKIKIDSCYECNQLWLDARELGGISLMYAKSQKVEHIRKEEAELDNKQFQDHIDARSLDRAVAKAFLTEFEPAIRPYVSGIGYKCPKCQNMKYETDEFRATGSFLTKMIDVQNKRFTTVICTRCRYVEIYQANSSMLGNIFDYFAG